MSKRSYLLLLKSVLKAEHHGEVGNVSYVLLLDSNERICFGWSVSLFILETFSLYFRVINCSSSFRSNFGMSVSVLIKWSGLSFPFVPDISPVTVIYNSFSGSTWYIGWIPYYISMISLCFVVFSENNFLIKKYFIEYVLHDWIRIKLN